MNSEITIVPYSSHSNKEQDEKLLQPFLFISQVPGKKIECKIIDTFNYWLKIPVEKQDAIHDIIQILHDSSLLIDDIADNSTLRKGIPVAHSIYGIANTINAANYVYFIALEKILSLSHPKAIEIFVEQILELHRGHGMDLYWRDNFICPSESEYRTMTIEKTGGLFKLGIRLMQLFSDSKEDFMPLLEKLGLYFQIRDDYCNLCSQEYTINKGYCEDLSEGKFSYPIVHALQNNPREYDQIISILRMRTKIVEAKRYCVNLLEKLGSFDYTRKILSDLDKQIRAEIMTLGDNPYLISILDKLLSWKDEKTLQLKSNFLGY